MGVSLAYTLNNLSILLYKIGKHEDCVAQFRRCLKISLCNNGEESSSTAAMLMNLGVAIYAIATSQRPVMHYHEKLDEAQDCLQRALRVKKTLLPHPRPAVAVCHANLGRVLQKKNCLTSAIQQFQSAVEIQRAVYDTENEDLARWTYMLGRTQCMQEETETQSEGRENLRQALKINEEVHRMTDKQALDDDQISEAEDRINVEDFPEDEAPSYSSDDEKDLENP